jgi:hypothetical protein
MKAVPLAIGLFGAVILSTASRAQIFDDPFSQYVERGITISPGAGDAQDANAAIQTIDPWPPYVGQTYIPGKGRCGVQSVEQMYHNPQPAFPHPSFAVGQGGGGTVNIGNTTNNNAPAAPGGAAEALGPGGC